jgi:hypothetical protein
MANVWTALRFEFFRNWYTSAPVPNKNDVHRPLSEAEANQAAQSLNGKPTHRREVGLEPLLYSFLLFFLCSFLTG